MCRSCSTRNTVFTWKLWIIPDDNRRTWFHRATIIHWNSPAKNAPYSVFGGVYLSSWFFSSSPTKHIQFAAWSYHWVHCTLIVHINFFSPDLIIERVAKIRFITVKNIIESGNITNGKKKWFLGAGGEIILKSNFTLECYKSRKNENFTLLPQKLGSKNFGFCSFKRF